MQMQTWFKSALLATSLLMSTLTCAQTLDRIAAVANDDVITELQLA